MTASTELPRFDIVFLDMDGVLADFQGAACKAHNKLPPAELAASGTWKPGDWYMPTVFGMNKEKFWRKIDEAPDFWAGLPALRDIKALFDLAQQLAPVARILTTPHGHASSYSGKWDWRQHHIPPAIKLCMVESSADKALLARPGRLLIDDSDENCDAFRAAGGSAILFPQHWNSAHDKAPFGPLFYLAQELEKLAREQSIPVESTETISEIRARKKLPPIRTMKIGGKHCPLNDEPSLAGLNEFGPGTNTGHGHAWKRPDGAFAKCLGLIACQECQREHEWLHQMMQAGEFVLLGECQPIQSDHLIGTLDSSDTWEQPLEGMPPRKLEKLS